MNEVQTINSMNNHINPVMLETTPNTTISVTPSTSLYSIYYPSHYNRYNDRDLEIKIYEKVKNLYDDLEYFLKRYDNIPKTHFIDIDKPDSIVYKLLLNDIWEDYKLNDQSLYKIRIKRSVMFDINYHPPRIIYNPVSVSRPKSYNKMIRRFKRYIKNVITPIIKESIREWAAKIIQRQWDKCYYNPKYLICRKVVIEGYYKMLPNSRPENE